MPPTSRWPLIYATGDGGKFIGAILAEPDKFEGKTLCAATRLYSMEEMVAALTKSTGQKVVYRQVPSDEFRASLPEAIADIFLEAFGFYDEFGYFGPGTDELVAWAAGNARGGNLTTLDDFFEKQPFQLEG